MNARTGAATVGAVSAGLWAALHRSSPVVRAWRQPQLPGRRVDALYARTGGTGDEAVLLLHGLVATGDFFGADFESLTDRAHLLVPDLLGFGRSLDESRSTFNVRDHLDALDELVDEAGLSDAMWTLGAHSMGSAVALQWAARHPTQVRRVVCWGAPIYAGAETVRAKMSESIMARLFVLDTQWAKRACSVSCRHRKLAGWLSAAAEPALPIPISRSVPLHTWPAYRDAMRHLVTRTDWGSLLGAADANNVAVHLVWGTNDSIGDRALAATLTSTHDRATISIVPGADHHLPLTHPSLCRDQLGVR